MHLSFVNFFKKAIKGHLFRGKYRLVRRVGLKAMETLRNDYELQEENMLYLRHPYLNLAESNGHAKVLNKKELMLKKWHEERTVVKMKPHITLEDRLMHLKVQERWE